MPTSQDHQFFEELNNNLVNSITGAIEGSLKKLGGGGGSVGREAPGAAIQIVSIDPQSIRTLADKIGRVSGGRGTGGGEDTPLPGGRGGAFGRGVKEIGKGLLSLLATNRITHEAIRNLKATFEFGNIIGRSALATGEQQLLASKNLSDSFGKFGFNTVEMGRMLETVMRSNVRTVTKGVQEFTARAAGFGVSIQKSSGFLAANTNTLGKDIEQSVALGNQIVMLAHNNGVFADAILDAVTSMTALTREQKTIFGPEVAEGIQKSVAGILAGPEGKTLIGMGPEVVRMMGLLAPTRGESAINLMRAAALVGAPHDPATMRDPGRMAEMQAAVIFGVAAEAQRARRVDPVRGAIGLERRLGAMGFDTAAIAAMEVIARAFGSEASLLKAMTRERHTKQEMDEADLAMQGAIIRTSSKALRGFTEFGLQINMLDKSFSLLGNTADFAADQWLDATGRFKGFVEDLASATFYAGITSMIAGALMPLVGVAGAAGAISRKMRPFPAGSTAATTGRGATWARGGQALAMARAAKGVPATLGSMSYNALRTLAAERGVGVGLGSAPTKTALIDAITKTGPGTGIGGAARSALRYGSRRIPVLGGVIGAGIEYDESGGDVSRALSVGGGEMAGMVGGTTLMAALLAATGVGAPLAAAWMVAAAIGGGIGGGKLGGAIHDAVAPIQATTKSVISSTKDMGQQSDNALQELVSQGNRRDELLHDMRAGGEAASDLLASRDLSSAPRGTGLLPPSLANLVDPLALAGMDAGVS